MISTNDENASTLNAVPANSSHSQTDNKNVKVPETGIHGNRNSLDITLSGYYSGIK